jgi:hypothetical protein
MTEVHIGHLDLKDDLITVLYEWAKTNIHEAMYIENDPAHVRRSLMELRRVMVGLAHVGYPGFAQHVQEIDKKLDRLHNACRSSLLKDYVRSRDPEEIASIGETLGECIAADRSWDWQAEFDAALAPSIAPAA